MPKRKARKSIGIIFPCISKHFRNNFFDSLVTAFYDRNYYASLCMTNGDIEMERYYIKQFAKTSDCIILMSCAKDYSQIEDVVPTNIPTIYAFNQPNGCPGTCILENDHQAVYQGVISVANQGFSKMAFLCTSFKNPFTQSIFSTYCDALSTISKETDFTENVIEINELDGFNPKKLLNSLTKKGFDSIFCTTSPLTSSMIDTIIVFQPENPDFKIPVVGYSYADTLLSCRLFANVIIPAYDEIINLIVQQALYQISHPEAEKRAYLLKGMLRTNQLTLP